ARALAMSAQGLGGNEIARKIGISNGTVHSWIREHRLAHGKPTRTIRKFDEAKIDKALAMIREGKSHNQTARELGVPQTSVSKWARRAGMKAMHHGGRAKIG